MKVDFFVAGTQKAGTTALDVYLRRHPAIQMAAQKEPHHFDNEAINWSHPDHSRLHAMFDFSARGVIRGEATPIYTFWPPALARIKAYNPNARLVVLFRDPIERAYSHWRMEVTRHAETLSFPEATRVGRARLDPGAPLSPAWRTFSYVERGLYASQVRRLLDLFPREQLLFLPAADLASDPSGTLSKVTQFLGVPPFGAIAPVTEHVGNRMLDPLADADIAYLRELFRQDLEEFVGLSDLDVSGWLTAQPGMPAS